MKSISIITILTVLCLNACGSSSRHKDLEAKLTETQKELIASKVINSQLQKKLGEKSVNNTELEISVSEMERALQEMASRKKEADARIQQYQSLTKKFKSLTDSGDLKIKMSDGRMMLELPSDVLFDSGSATISEKGRGTLVKTARLLSEIPDRKFQIEGHTDNLPIKTARFPSNWELASARSIAVVSTMISSGMSSNRLSAASFGDTRPIADNGVEETRKLNRRIEIVILPDLSQLPGHHELEELSEE